MVHMASTHHRGVGVCVRDVKAGSMPWCFQGSAGQRQPRNRVLCFGDSLTAGFCSSGAMFRPYGEVMAEKMDGVDVSVCGMSGRTTEDMLVDQESMATTDCAGVGHVGKGLVRILQDDPLDVALILSGTNDLGQSLCKLHISAQLIFDRIKRLHSICHSSGVPTVALIPPTIMHGPCRAMQRKLSALIETWAKSEPMVLGHFDIEKLVPRGGHLWDSDGIHMSFAGQTQLGSTMAKLLRSLLLSTSIPGSRAMDVSDAAFRRVATPPRIFCLASSSPSCARDDSPRLPAPNLTHKFISTPFVSVGAKVMLPAQQTATLTRRDSRIAGLDGRLRVSCGLAMPNLHRSFNVASPRFSAQWCA